VFLVGVLEALALGHISKIKKLVTTTQKGIADRHSANGLPESHWSHTGVTLESYRSHTGVIPEDTGVPH